MQQKVLNRLDRLQRRICSSDNRIVKVIDTGAFYDELTEEDKDAYCEYRQFTREIMEKVEMSVNNSLHFQLRRIPEQEPLEKIQAEIIALMES